MTSRSRCVSALGHVGDVGTGVFADDGAHGIDVLVDELDRDVGHVRGVLEQPAQALGDAGDFGIAERGGLALDVVGGAKQRVVRLLGKAQRADVLARAFRDARIPLHPAGELGRQLDQRRFGARDRIVVAVPRPAPPPCAARAAA